MKKILFCALVAISLILTSCVSFGGGSIGTTMGGMIGGMAGVLTGNDGNWKSQIDSNVTVQFSSAVAGRDSGQNWYKGTVTKNGKSSPFIWVTSSYTDENNTRKNELFVKEGSTTGTTKPAYRYVLNQSVYSITIIFTEEGSGSGAKISSLPVPNGMYSQYSN